LSEKTNIRIAAAYNINQASNNQPSSRATDDSVLNLKADILYSINEFFDLGLQYNYYAVAYTHIDSRIEQNRVLLRIVAKYPMPR
jgi:hypothetical protein